MEIRLASSPAHCQKKCLMILEIISVTSHWLSGWNIPSVLDFLFLCRFGLAVVLGAILNFV